MVRRLTTAVAVLVVVVGIFLPAASAMVEVEIRTVSAPGNPAILWVDPADPTAYMQVYFIRDDPRDDRGPAAELAWRGTTSLGEGNHAVIDFDGYPLGNEPCTGERSVPTCGYATFTHDHMSTAAFYMNARGTQYVTGRDDGSSMQISGSFRVWISWTGTGTVRKTIGPDGSITRTRDAVIDLRATFKDVVLVDATGLPGGFPTVTRCCG